jgi:tetratricopeptide (TPR) repeat protein
MSGRRWSPLFFALLWVAAASSPRGLLAQAPGGSIIGQVRIAPGHELKSPVIVTLESRGATIRMIYTDGEGRFSFNGLPANLYHVVINEKDYQRIEESVAIDPISSSTRLLTIYLVPRDVQKPEESSAVKGGNTHLTGSTEYTQQIPRPARKEYEKGVKSDRDGKTDDAVWHYQKAIALAPDFYAARNNLGSDFLSKSQFPEAQQQFESVIKVNPSDAAAYFNLGNLSLLRRQYEQAEHLVEQGLSKQPDSAFGHFLRGSLDARSGKDKEAEAALRRCLELDPVMSKAHLALVNLYLQQKRNDEAASELRSFLKAFPEDPFAPRARQVLEKLEVPAAESKPQ